MEKETPGAWYISQSSNDTSLGESAAARHSWRRTPILLSLLSLLFDDIITVHKIVRPSSTEGGRQQKCLVLLAAGPLCG